MPRLVSCPFPSRETCTGHDGRACPDRTGFSQLDADEARGAPVEAGIYRQRCRREPNLLYIGISDRLRSRLTLGSLRRASAAGRTRDITLLPVSLRTRRTVRLSMFPGRPGDMDRRELMGREADLIAARRRLLDGPARQFHGQVQAFDGPDELHGLT